MKVLLASHGYPPELVGGTELATRDLARARTVLAFLFPAVLRRWVTKRRRRFPPPYSGYQSSGSGSFSGAPSRITAPASRTASR